MWLNKLKTSIKQKSLPETAEPQTLHLLCAAGDFEQVLQQERRAADQTGHEFSLLVFEFNHNTPDEGVAHKLWQVVHRRMRETAKLGWLSKHSLGLILPETPFSGGRKVAEDICRTLEAAIPSVSYKILTYPPRHEIS